MCGGGEREKRWRRDEQYFIVLGPKSRSEREEREDEVDWGEGGNVSGVMD